MKYLQRFKGLIIIALACSVTAQGSTVVSTQSKDDPQQKEIPTVYSVSVSSGQDQGNEAKANLTIAGENSKVSIEKGGTVNLTAGKSIILRPGTKVSSGGFLYASIEPIVKTGKRQKKVIKLVTIEENRKIEEQASLATAYTLFSPFPAPRSGFLHAGAAENGSFTSSNNELSGVAPEQQRKMAVDSRPVVQATPNKLKFSTQPVAESIGYRAETMRVLRL